VKIFLSILTSSILSRWPSQLVLCPFVYFTIFFSFGYLFQFLISPTFPFPISERTFF
jgi:hypothetical protein